MKPGRVWREGWRELPASRGEVIRIVRSGREMNSNGLDRK